MKSERGPDEKYKLPEIRNLLFSFVPLKMSITFPRGALKGLATVTKPTPNVFLLSMHNLPDNRLTPNFIKQALLPALDYIELEYQTALSNGKGEAAVVLCGEVRKNKFFSNGLQLELVAECPGFFKVSSFASKNCRIRADLAELGLLLQAHVPNHDLPRLHHLCDQRPLLCGWILPLPGQFRALLPRFEFRD